jgi:hypothetical protein
LTAQATAHAFRHVDRLGLDRAVIMGAIIADLSPHLPLSLPINNQPFQVSVMIAGLELRYHAFPLDNGIVNVGRITPPQTGNAAPTQQ